MNVTDYPLIEPPFYLPKRYECRGNAELVIVWDPVDELHIDVQRSSLEGKHGQKNWTVCLRQLAASRQYKRSGGQFA